jgi:UPF0716 family protein affecting phage T7 exclusion
MTLSRAIPRLVVAAAVAGSAIGLAADRDTVDPALIESAIRDLGALAPLGHAVLFAVATVLFVPGAIFGLAGGMIFGPFWRALFNLVVALCVAADRVRRRAGRRPDRLVAGVGAEGWRGVCAAGNHHAGSRSTSLRSA